MIITSSTKYEEFEPFEDKITDESKDEIKAAAVRQFKPYHTLTLNEFWGALSYDYSLLGDLSEPSVLQVYWLKGFYDFLKEFTTACEKLVAKDPENEGLQEGCAQLSAQESMLIFVREYFGLHSFEAAGDITIGEYILARKDHFNEWRVRKNNEAKQLQKMKRK